MKLLVSYIARFQEGQREFGEAIIEWDKTINGKDELNSIRACISQELNGAGIVFVNLIRLPIEEDMWIPND